MELRVPVEPEPLFGTLAEIYREAFAELPFPASETTVRQLAAEILPRHAEREDFKLLLAVEAEEIVGFIYGYSGAHGQQWEDWLAARIPAPLYAEWFHSHFAVTEFCVRPAFQGRGIGGALHDTLLAGLPHERAVLTAHRADTRARHLYARRGWEVLWEAVDDRHSLLGKRLAPGPVTGPPGPIA